VRKTLLLVLPLLFAAGCGDPLFFAQVSDSKVCFVVDNESVPAAPSGIGPVSVNWNGSFDLSSIPGHGRQDTTGNVTMLSLEIDSTTDMSGITNVVVALPGIVSGDYIDYTQATPSSDLTSILMTPTQPNVNLLSALTNGGTLPYSITLTGSPPTVAWQANITACVSVNLEVNLAEAAE